MLPCIAAPAEYSVVQGVAPSSLLLAGEHQVTINTSTTYHALSTFFFTFLTTSFLPLPRAVKRSMVVKFPVSYMQHWRRAQVHYFGRVHIVLPVALKVETLSIVTQLGVLPVELDVEMSFHKGRVKTHFNDGQVHSILRESLKVGTPFNGDQIHGF